MFKLTGLQPSSRVAQSPIKFSEQAETLLFAAYLMELDGDPQTVLINLPRECLNFLHYTFLIVCDEDVAYDLKMKTRAIYTVVDMGKYHCLLGTGALSVWYDAVVLNLTHPQMLRVNTNILLNKLMLALEKEGLQAIFGRYNKEPNSNTTFLLE